MTKYSHGNTNGQCVKWISSERARHLIRLLSIRPSFSSHKVAPRIYSVSLYVSVWLPDTSASRHSRTLRHRSQDTSTKTWYRYESLRHECRDRRKAGTLRPRTIPMRHSSTGDSSSCFLDRWSVVLEIALLFFYYKPPPPSPPLLYYCCYVAFICEVISHTNCCN